MKINYQMFSAYNRWANQTVYDAVAELSEDERSRDLGAFFGSLMATLNHLLAADRIWMKRFTGKGEAPLALNAVLHHDFVSLAEARKAEDRRISDWIATLSDEDLASTFSYVPMSSPVPQEQRLAPAIVHMFNHHTHHRGQCHMMLTVLGKPSLGLDLIYFLRTDEGAQWR